MFDVTVDQYNLSVAARDTVQAVLDDYDTDQGSTLNDALVSALSNYSRAAYAVPPFTSVTADDFQDGDPWPEISDYTEVGVLRALEKAGYVELNNVWNDPHGNGTYLDEGRILTCVRVLKSFTVVNVNFRRVAGQHYFDIPDQVIMGRRTRPVATGTYLVAEVGDFRMSFVGVTGIDRARPNERGTDSESLFYRIADQEGFCASRAEAGCDACDAVWSAESGNWKFRPEVDGPNGVSSFYYDDAEDHDDWSILCPHCSAGRVGFLIF